MDGCAASGEFPTFSLDASRVVPRWIHWQTKNASFWEKCDALSRGTSGKNRIKPELFLTIRVPLPPLPEQVRLVARIEELAAKIEEARGFRKQAAEEVEALLESAINKVFTGSESRFWRKVTFGDEDVLQIIDGDRGKNYPAKMDFTEGGYCVFLNTGNVRKGFFEFSRCEFITSEKDAALRKGKLLRGDVILTTRGTLGNFAHYDDAVRFENMRINSGMVILRPNTNFLLPQYLRVILNSPLFSGQVITMLSGSAQSQLPINKLSLITFLLPSTEKQTQIVQELEGFQAAVDAVKRMQGETATDLDAFMPSILDKAFRGEL